MKPANSRALLGTALLLALEQLPGVLAHGQGTHGSSDEMQGQMHSGMVNETKPEIDYPPTYFTHPEHAGVMFAHIALMAGSWIVILPVAVMLSLVRSRYTLPVQFVFLATNAFGVLLATIYNAQTPDLYPNNAHHSIGWIVTAVVSAQVMVSLVGRVANALGSHRSQTSQGDQHRFLPVSGGAHESETDHHHHYHPSLRFTDTRLSDDSGQGTERNTESLRSSAASTQVDEEEGLPMMERYKEHDEDEDGMPTVPAAPTGRSGVIANKIVSSRLWKYLHFGYKVVDRIILPFGFVALTTGIVTYGRFFEGRHVFNGLAHWIKGGVFFWLGLFNLGRWAGSFGEIGWAWNIRPRQRQQRWRPSAEWAESFLIFFYGSTNIFLEHMASSDAGKSEYSTTDLEHLSITVLFIGGGLCGMLIESTFVRTLLNTSVTNSIDHNEHAASSDEAQQELQPPKTYSFSLNPIPALVIMLLGIMMSSHHQKSMISTMIHAQWGNLLVGASFARALTYVLLYLRPPQSVLPSRPPTELLASFALIAGGIIFMASSSDTVTGMEHYELDEMFMYTVTMGLVGLLMAWEICVLAIKGMAHRMELRGVSRRFM